MVRKNSLVLETFQGNSIRNSRCDHLNFGLNSLAPPVENDFLLKQIDCVSKRWLLRVLNMQGETTMFKIYHRSKFGISLRARPRSVRQVEGWDGQDLYTQLSKLFVEHFYSGRCQHSPATYLLNVRQEKGESLPNFLKCFSNKALLVDEIDNKVTLTAFIGGLQPTWFFYHISEKLTTNIAELINKARHTCTDKL
ncbi:hypothetical protein Vadar_024582 [Vaccinium darrowii]|uniref:Uncharacterized protein n=1 Tax=Vaccinium darrowii TaxID=229202 RepID=A0ACB7ZLL2_9ERIC|nr:hypothetical protein Vadar_024582 [Vaccinium darrowii]